MDKCDCCGAELRPGQASLCKTCRQNIMDGKPWPPAAAPRKKKAVLPTKRRGK